MDMRTALKNPQDSIWDTALQRVYTDGARWPQPHTTESARSNGRRTPTNGNPLPVLWHTLAVDAGRTALSGIIQWPTLERGRTFFQDPTSWTICSIYRGLVPRILATTWRVTLGGLPKPIVSQVTRWFCRYIEREGREQIWKTRCQETVAWEKENGITEQQKKAKAPQGCGRRWQQIYGRTISEQECMCGYLLDDHFDGECPGEQNDCMASRSTATRKPFRPTPPRRDGEERKDCHQVI